MGKGGVYSYPRKFDPSAAATDTDQETLACLRAEAEGEKAGRGLATLEVNDRFYELRPSQLPSCFVLRKPQQHWPMLGPVGQGSWKRKEGYRLAIRNDGVSRSHIPCRPEYIGMKSFLEFHLPDGTKTDWLMVEYRLFDDCFYVEGELQLYKVFQLKRKGPVPSDDAAAQLPNQVPLHPTMSSSSPTNPETPFDDLEKFFSDFDVNDHNIGVPGPVAEYTDLSIEDYTGQWIPEYTDISIEDYTGQWINVDAQDISWGPPSSGREGQHWENREPVVPNGVQLMGKRSKSIGNGKSEVWKDFTKIRSEDPDVVYAACHYCDRMYKAHPKKDGTSHLKRHTAKCMQDAPESTKAKCSAIQ